MPAAWSLDKRLYGTNQPVCECTAAAVGALHFSVEGTQLRHLHVAGFEVLRGVGLVIRDAWWGSHVLEPTRSQTHATPERWRRELAGRVADANGGPLLEWQLNLTVEPQRVVVIARLQPLSDFTTCRAGLMLLHPLRGVVAAPVAVTHSDGQVEQGHFPDLISPCQPFFDIRALRHSPLPGLQLHWQLEGDVFEMEDQRNWSDASFKTYNRPLAWPCPYVLEAGSTLEQRIELHVTGEVLA